MFFRRWFEKEEEDIHIKILRYALRNPGFAHGDLIKQFSLNQEEQIFIGSEISHNGDFFTYVGNSNDRGYKFMLSFEGRSRLLEYDELKEARENSRKAHVIAIFALALSILGVLVQLFSN